MTPAKTTQGALLFFLIHTVFFAVAQPSGYRYGEIRVKRFITKEDSLHYQTIEQNIEEEMRRKPLRQRRIDSLMVVQQKLYSERMIFKTIYRPWRDFVVTDSIKENADLDTIRKVCVYYKNEVPDIVWKCRNLEAIQFINTSIRRLPAELDGLSKLTEVQIYNNRSRGRIRLSNNNNITTLTIRNQSPKGLPRSFRKFKALTRLDLAENALTRFPNGARHNRQLTELSLQRNALTLSGRIKRHRWLERLSLHDNRIEKVPASISNCTNLRKLNFNSNRITTVHPSIGSLKKIEQLSFYNNKLNAIPSGLYRMESLRELDLFYNEIDHIDDAFVRWQNLNTLYLSHNKLVSIPEKIDTLRNLEGLYLWDNRLGSLPERTGNLTQLKYLRVNNNYLKKLPDSIVALRQLEELDVSHNYIETIPPEIFNLLNLKILALVNNPWNAEMMQLISQQAEGLRARGVFVHLSDDDDN